MSLRAFTIAACLCAASLAGPPVVAQTAAPRAQAPASTTASAAGVSAALTTWVEAFNSRDPKRITALYAPTAVFWGTTARTLATSPEEIWAYFKDAGQRPDTRVTIDSEYIRVFGDIVIASGGYTFADVKDGVTSNVRPSRFTIVFKREGDRLVIVNHHSSRVPE